MVSFGRNSSFSSTMTLLLPIALPTLTCSTSTVFVTVPVGVCFSTSTSFLHPATESAEAANNPNIRPFELRMVRSSFRNLQDLSGMDEIRIVQDVAVGVVDSPPSLRIAVDPLRDLGEAVAFHHAILHDGGVDLRLRRSRAHRSLLR